MLTDEEIQKIESEMKVGQVWYAFVPWLSVYDVCEVEERPGDLYFRSRGKVGGYSAENLKYTGVYRHLSVALAVFAKSQDRLADEACEKAGNAKHAAFAEYDRYRKES